MTKSDDRVSRGDKNSNQSSDRSSDRSSDNGGLETQTTSALERYLAKRGLQRTSQNARSTSPNPANPNQASVSQASIEFDIAAAPRPASEAGSASLRDSRPSSEVERGAGSVSGPEAKASSSDESSHSARETAKTKEQTAPRVSAGLWRRFFAMLIDHIITGTLYSTAAALLGFGFSRSEGYQYGLLGLAVWYLYYGYFYTQFNASPGKLLFEIEVESTAVARSAEPMTLTYGQAFFRETVGKFISACLLGFGYFLAFFRADHKALHDLLFNTRVVRRMNP